MTLRKNQDKPGPEHRASPNDTNRTGRSDGTDVLRGPDGKKVSDSYPFKQDSNPTQRTGRGLPQQGNVRGYSKPKDQTPNPTDVSANKRRKLG
jgi:hypothetical protein